MRTMTVSNLDWNARQTKEALNLQTGCISSQESGAEHGTSAMQEEVVEQQTNAKFCGTKHNVLCVRNYFLSSFQTLKTAEEEIHVVRIPKCLNFFSSFFNQTYKNTAAVAV